MDKNFKKYLTEIWWFSKKISEKLSIKKIIFFYYFIVWYYLTNLIIYYFLYNIYWSYLNIWLNFIWWFWLLFSYNYLHKLDFETNIFNLKYQEEKILINLIILFLLWLFISIIIYKFFS